MTSDQAKIGVLVMSYGTPASLEQVEEYYTHIRRGRPPSPEQLAELTERYEAIVGGVFPLRENTNKQVAALEQALNDMDTPHTFVCYQGLRHAEPFIEEGITQMAQDGIRQAVGIVLTPHYSQMHIGGYFQRAREQAVSAGIEIQFVESYHEHPMWIGALADRIEATMQQFEQDVRDQVKVIFTAHSLPARILETDDPYIEQLHSSSAAVAQQAGVSDWQFEWQSAGDTGMPWLGPDVTEVLKRLAEEEQVRHILICPIGFVSDHLEILYDIDIECQQIASELGMNLKRTPSLNTDPRYIDTLADCVLSKLSSP